MILQKVTGGGPDGGAARILVLEMLGNRVEADPIGKGSRKSCVAQTDRPTFQVVGGEKLRSGPALHRAGQLPSQVDDVFDRRVVAEAARRTEQMGGIARNEDATGGVAVGDKTVAAVPRHAVQPLDRVIDAEHLAEEAAFVEVGKRELLLRWPELHVEHERVDAVDRRQGAAARGGSG